LTWVLSWRRAAEADVAEAVDWYNEQAEGLGARLLAEVDAVGDRLRANPLQFPVIYKDARRARLRTFPYIVIFRVRDQRLRVVAVFHTRRDPRGWQSRVQ
jgi:toxin ParE1/3/4